MDLINRINHTSFLGREFLTWLWYRSEQQEGIFQIGDRAVEVWFDARLTLETPGEIKEQNVIVCESPTEADEARASLLAGKQATAARLRIVSDQKQWTCNFKAEDISLSTLKLPALLSREDEDQLYERFYLLEEVQDILDDLFKTFVEIRIEDDTWREEVGAMRAWVHAS